MSNLGGKENDVRIDIKNILWVEMPDCNLGFEIPPNQSWFTDEDWKKQYPTAYAIYRIYGISPHSYVTKTKIK
ncbi:MAG: hypothetical protein JXB49_33965 [Bacteroidales bacterium]|nr:hypothetical protein [Bacteroidales bacterium]